MARGKTQDLAAAFKALSNPNRLKVFDIIRRGRACCSGGAADQPAAPAPDAPSACAVSSAALDALASAAKGDCDLATFLRLMQNATPEERRLIRNFLDALRSKSGQ